MNTQSSIQGIAAASKGWMGHQAKRIALAVVVGLAVAVSVLLTVGLAVRVAVVPELCCRSPIANDAMGKDFSVK